MATTQHPTHKGVRFHVNHEWLWIGLSAILVGLIAAAIVWAMSRPETTTSTAMPEAVSGFEYDHEVTAGRTVGPGITGTYFGNSGELFSEIPLIEGVAAVPGIDSADIKFLPNVSNIDSADIKFLPNVSNIDPADIKFLGSP